jgi:radical SAM protein with 4Fe4S-binding SPASM domain
MEKRNIIYLALKTAGKKEHYPWCGQLELTYRCSLDCVHCYGKAMADGKRELTTAEWKRIIDTLHREGCLWLVFTGGDPLIRDDFLQLYSYAKKKGFIITVYTNGHLLTGKIIARLVKEPPLSIEITLNGITSKTYESITQVKGSLARVVKNIRLLAKTKIKLILKSNCLKQNKHEIAGIKAWTEKVLGGAAENKLRFKYGPLIYPRLDGDRTPCDYQLSFEEMVEFKRQDGDIWRGYQEELHRDSPGPQRDGSFLYRCDSWKQYFHINPYGRLKFCSLSDKFSVDLKTTPFKEGFYKFSRLLGQKFKTDSKCRDCRLRPVCYFCPARAYLETGNEEAPVPYYCRLAKETAKATAQAE